MQRSGQGECRTRCWIWPFHNSGNLSRLPTGFTGPHQVQWMTWNLKKRFVGIPPFKPGRGNPGERRQETGSTSPRGTVGTPGPHTGRPAVRPAAPAAGPPRRAGAAVDGPPAADEEAVVAVRGGRLRQLGPAVPRPGPLPAPRHQGPCSSPPPPWAVWEFPKPHMGMGRLGPSPPPGLPVLSFQSCISGGAYFQAEIFLAVVVWVDPTPGLPILPCPPLGAL